MSQQQIDMMCLIALCVALPLVHMLESKIKSRKKREKETVNESANDKFAGRRR
jgi:hypothetical protein